MLRRGFYLLMVCLLVAACQPAKAPQGGATGETDALPVLERPAAAQRLLIDGEASLLTVRVYRGGRMASLGHNHIISSRDLRGELWLTDSGTGSVFEIRMPAATLRVDDPELRAAAGDEFPGELDENAISGTRSNMLSESQLDADNWPTIVVRGQAEDMNSVTAWLAVKSQVHAMQVPVTLTRSPGRVTITGGFAVTQTELGLEAFSVMLGALRVEDRLDINFRLEACQFLYR